MLSSEQIKDIRLGVRIQFKSSSRFGDKIVWRIVTGWSGKDPTVRFRGQNNFVVSLTEILDIGI